MKRLYMMIFLVILILCGCSNVQQPESTKKRTSEVSIQNKSDISTSNSNIRMAVDWPGLFNTPKVSSSAGCYEIMYNIDGSANILYTDIATKQRIYLSSDMSSDHHTDSDTSWIEDSTGGYFPFVIKDNFYLSYFGYEDAPGAIFKMNLDGRNRERLTSFADYDEGLSGAIAYNEECMFALLSKNTNKILVSIDLESGKIDELEEFDLNSVFLMSSFEDNIIIKTIETSDIETEDELEKYLSQIHRVFKYSLTDKTMEMVVEWKQDDIQESYSESKIYMFDKIDNTLKELNIISGQKSIISTFSDNDFSVENITNVLPVYDNHIIWNVDDGSNKNRRMFIDLSNFQIGDINSFENDMFLGIIGEYGDVFLVVNGSLDIPLEDAAPDGSPIITNMKMDKLSIINKNDFWQNKFDLQSIEDTFLE